MRAIQIMRAIHDVPIHDVHMHDDPNIRAIHIMRAGHIMKAIQMMRTKQMMRAMHMRSIHILIHVMA